MVVGEGDDLSNCVPHLCILAPAEKTLRVSRVGEAGPPPDHKGPTTGGREGGGLRHACLEGRRPAQRLKEVVPRPPPQVLPSERLSHSLSHGQVAVQMSLSLPLEVTLRKSRLV